MNPFDVTIATFFHYLQSYAGFFFTPFFRLISWLGDYGIAVSLFLLFALIFRRTRRAGLVAFFAVIFGLLFGNLFLKNLVARPRPFADEQSAFHVWWLAAGALKEEGYSFPSGHTTMAAAVGFSLCFSLKKKKALAFLLFPFLMGASRVYFAVHYASDVLGAWLLGAIVASLALLLVHSLSHFDGVRDWIENPKAV